MFIPEQVTLSSFSGIVINLHKFHTIFNQDKTTVIHKTCKKTKTKNVGGC